MRKEISSSASFADSKPHYELLDGLRGAVALMVLWYHVFEGFAFAEGTGIETFNHGHIGVDFFFMLSGFVISYAYDDRWKSNASHPLTIGNFFKRRLIRLHPMLIIGAIIGTIAFLLQGGVTWEGNTISLPWVVMALVLTMLFIPAYAGAGYEIRGNGEMFPLNGPAWSLFFEYIGNILYAMLIRRLSNRLLGCLVAVTGVLWAWFSVTDLSGYDSLGVGWAIDSINFWGGLLRMLFPSAWACSWPGNSAPARCAAPSRLYARPCLPSFLFPPSPWTWFPACRASVGTVCSNSPA